MLMLMFFYILAAVFLRDDAIGASLIFTIALHISMLSTVYITLSGVLCGAIQCMGLRLISLVLYG